LWIGSLSFVGLRGTDGDDGDANANANERERASKHSNSNNTTANNNNDDDVNTTSTNNNYYYFYHLVSDFGKWPWVDFRRCLGVDVDVDVDVDANENDQQQQQQRPKYYLGNKDNTQSNGPILAVAKLTFLLEERVSGNSCLDDSRHAIQRHERRPTQTIGTDPTDPTPVATLSAIDACRHLIELPVGPFIPYR